MTINPKFVYGPTVSQIEFECLACNWRGWCDVGVPAGKCPNCDQAALSRTGRVRYLEDADGASGVAL